MNQRAPHLINAMKKVNAHARLILGVLNVINALTLLMDFLSVKVDCIFPLFMRISLYVAFSYYSYLTFLDRRQCTPLLGVEIFPKRGMGGP